MDEFDLEYAELQFVGDTEVGDHTAAQVREIDALLRGRGKPVSCLSRHVFAGMTSDNRPGNALHTKHMDALKRVIGIIPYMRGAFSGSKQHFGRVRIYSPPPRR